jgi:hypothetical protein
MCWVALKPWHDFAWKWRRACVRITFFAGSVVGYVENPSALLTRGLAHGLALRGHDVRVVEQRRNEAYVRTVVQERAGAARHFFDAFRTIQHHTYDPRTGAPLLEWLTREVALIDVAVAVGGLDDELCRWIANVTRDRLLRSYLAWELPDVAASRLVGLEIERFDLILAPFYSGELPVPVRLIPATAAGADVDAGLAATLESFLHGPIVDPIEAAIAFERAVSAHFPAGQ